MDPTRRRKPGVTPLEVTFGEAFVVPPNRPVDTPIVDAYFEPLTIEVDNSQAGSGDEASRRALQELIRGRR
jgi:hypothetical protein